MSLNIINEVEIKALSKTLMDIVKDEEKILIQHLKLYQSIQT